MSIRAALAVLATSVAVVAPAAAAHGSAPTLDAKVGPGFTISMSKAGHKVTALKPGTYRLLVHDRSSSHDFHLKGPGLNKVVTSVGFTGDKAITLTLKKGTYTFVCDPHSSEMHGGFAVR
jgi:plastocyanin